MFIKIPNNKLYPSNKLPWGVTPLTLTPHLTLHHHIYHQDNPFFLLSLSLSLSLSLTHTHTHTEFGFDLRGVWAEKRIFVVEVRIINNGEEVLTLWNHRP